MSCRRCRRQSIADRIAGGGRLDRREPGQPHVTWIGIRRRTPDRQRRVREAAPRAEAERPGGRTTRTTARRAPRPRSPATPARLSYRTARPGVFSTGCSRSRRLGLDRHLSGEPDRRDHGADPSPERRREDGPLRYLCLSERGDPVERANPPATRRERMSLASSITPVATGCSAGE